MAPRTVTYPLLPLCASISCVGSFSEARIVSNLCHRPQSATVVQKPPFQITGPQDGYLQVENAIRALLSLRRVRHLVLI
jgi:hypothetical protein